MKGFNEWYLDVDLKPTVEQLEARTQGIEAFARNGSKECVCELARLYFGMPTNEDTIGEFVEYFSDKDPSFSTRDQEELTLLAGAALLHLAEERSEFGCLAELLCAVLAGYRRPASSERILARLLHKLDQDSLALRAANNAGTGSVSIDEAIDELASDLGDKATWSPESTGKLIAILRNIQQKTEVTLQELRNELSIKREDSQILWWMMAQWSNFYQVPLKELGKDAACLTVGVEAAAFVEKYPGPHAMKAVLYHAIGNCKGKSAALPLTDVIRATGDKWMDSQRERLDENRLLQLLPIHMAIVRSHNTTSDEQWYPKFCEDVLRGENWEPVAPKEYAWRTYLEELTIKCYESQ